MKVAADYPVLHVLTPARQGGLERVVEMLALGQAPKGVHVASVVGPNDANDHPFVAKLRAAGIPVTPIVVEAREYRREFQLLSDLVEKLKPRIVHTHGYRADVMGLLLRRRSGVPHVSTVHGFVGGTLRNRIYENVQRYVLRRASGVIAVSRPLVEKLSLSGIPRKKIHLVANGLSLSEPGLTREAARLALGIDHSAQTGGWIGRLSREKGPDIMIEAIGAAGKRWHLAMIGDGPATQVIRRRVVELGLSERVTLHGELPNAARYLAAFDAFILSSRTEGTPIALLEAMHAGVPVLAASVGGVPDVVGDDTALVVPAEDPGAIARALHVLESDPDGARRRAEMAKMRIESHFDLKSWVEMHESVYRTVVRQLLG
jgi:glycosyltransferase involved in cell wall biosynthesis